MCRSSVPVSEYEVADRIPTDNDYKPCAIITLGEEALEWHQMSSDSDSEYDYDDGLSDGEVVESWVGVGEDLGQKVEAEIDEEEAVIGSGYSKSSSSSDSDEDYTVPYQRKRGGGSGRGRGRRGRGGGADSRTSGTSPATRPVGRPRLTHNTESSVSTKNSSSTALSAPPPLVSPQARPPSLIKAEPYSQDPSVLVAPKFNTSNSQNITKVGVVQGADKFVKREPPPLVKKSDEFGASGQPVVAGGGGSRQPRFILPSPSSLGVGGESLAPGGNLSSAPSAPVKRRPGRPRKDQSVALSTNHTQRTSRVHHLSHGRGGGRGRGSRGGAIIGLASNTPAASGKLKVTQYEFQEQRQQQQSLVSAGQGVFLTTPTNHAPSPSATTPTQFQPLILQPGTNTALQPNIVTPLQIVSTGQGALPTPIIQNIPTVPQGNVIYLQSSVPQQEQSPQYITKDGQLYQILTPTTAPTLGDGTKKLSVIMQPTAAGAQPTYVQASDIGNLQYITQLDGPPPPQSTSSSSSSSSSLDVNATYKNVEESLNRKFELVRQRMTIMQLDGTQPPGSGTTSTTASSTASTTTTTTTMLTTTRTASSATAAEGKCPSKARLRGSSDLLQTYFDRVPQYSKLGGNSSIVGREQSVGEHCELSSRISHARSGGPRGRKVGSQSKGERSQRGKSKRGRPSRLAKAVDSVDIPSVTQIRGSVSPVAPLSPGAEGFTLSAAKSQRGKSKRGRPSRLAKAVDSVDIPSVTQIRGSVSPVAPLSPGAEGFTLSAASEVYETGASGDLEISKVHTANNTCAETSVHVSETPGSSGHILKVSDSKREGVLVGEF